jgi:hypothetical protein
MRFETKIMARAAWNLTATIQKNSYGQPRCRLPEQLQFIAGCRPRPLLGRLGTG